MVALIVCLTLMLMPCKAHDITNSSLNVGGIITVNTNSQVILEKDSMLITVVYETRALYKLWNDYISQAEELASSIGPSLCIGIINPVTESGITSPD